MLLIQGGVLDRTITVLEKKQEAKYLEHHTLLRKRVIQKDSKQIVGRQNSLCFSTFYFYQAISSIYIEAEQTKV